MKLLRAVYPALLVPLFLACGTSSQGVEADSDAGASPGSADAGEPAAPPIKVPVVDPPANTGPGLALVAPEGWVPEAPASAFRTAQYRLARVGDDAEDAELVVFRMAAGSFSQNVERWTAQFEQPDGTPSSEVATRSTRRVADMPLHEFECSGTYVAETMPGSGERVNKPGFKLLAAVVESPYGPYYFKFTGPAATVDRWRASYTEFLSSLEP